MSITVETYIAGLTPDEVFTAVLDIEAWPRRVPDINAIEVLTPGPVGVGTVFRETRTMFGRQASEDMTFAEIDRPNNFALTAESHGTAYRTEHTFVADGDGTRLSISFDGKPLTRVNKIIGPFMEFCMKGTLERMLRADLRHVRDALLEEARQSSSAS